MKKEFFVSVILLAVFICCSALYRKLPSTSGPVQKAKVQQHSEAVVK